MFIARDACFLSSNNRVVSGVSLSSSPMGVLPSLFTRPVVVFDGTVVVSGEGFSDKEHPFFFSFSEMASWHSKDSQCPFHHTMNITHDRIFEK